MHFKALSKRQGRIVWAATVLACAATFMPGLAAAADSTGNYAVRGLGSSTCAQYTTAVDGNTADLRSYIAWIEGAVTATNRLSVGVFDAVPFNAPGALAAMVLRQCRQQPTLIFDAALRRTLDTMQQLRVTTNSPWVEMTVGANRVTLRAETLAYLQGRLVALSLQTVPPDGRFSVATREALKRFQQMRRLPVTELPDPDTLIALVSEP